MSETTKISWCDSTANPWIGCSKCSPGCLNCYAEHDTPARVLRHQGMETWGPFRVQHPVLGFEKTMFALNRKPWVCDKCGAAIVSSENPGTQYRNCWHDDKASYHRRRVFIGSNCDILDDAVHIGFLARTLDVMRRCPDLTQILCTKRPEDWLKLSRDVWQERYDNRQHDGDQWYLDWFWNNLPPKNVIVMTSAENQEMADKRIPELLRIPSVCRGISAEPLLGPLDVSHWCVEGGGGGLDWIVAGRESGPKARPCNIDWLRSLRDQARASGAAFHCKQFGSDARQNTDGEMVPLSGPMSGMSNVRILNAPLLLRNKSGADPDEWSEDMRVREWPKGF